jgi:hypothetical protein
MTPTEIVTANKQKKGRNPRKVLLAIKRTVSKGNGFLLHENNSVLFGVYIAPNEAELHLFSEDSPLQLLHSLKEFIAKIRKSKLKAVYGKANNPAIVQFLKKAGVQVKSSDKPIYNWMALV